MRVFAHLNGFLNLGPLGIASDLGTAQNNNNFSNVVDPHSLETKSQQYQFQAAIDGALDWMRMGGVKDGAVVPPLFRRMEKGHQDVPVDLLLRDLKPNDFSSSKEAILLGSEMVFSSLQPGAMRLSSGQTSSRISSNPPPPNSKDIDTLNREKLKQAGVASWWRYESLSPMAREGIYLLLSKNVPAENIRLCLENPAAVEVGGATRIFELVTLMYEHGVEGFERGFLSTGFDSKFLSGDRARVYSQWVEYQEALKLAALSDAEKVEVGGSFRIDWLQLTPDEKAFIEKRILPFLKPVLAHSYLDQRQVELDAIVTPPKPSLRRIVEFKTSLWGRFLPSEEETASIQLQVFRHALLVRLHRLEGIEMVIRASEVNSDFLKKLVEAFEKSGVKYLVRLEGGREKRIIAGGIDYHLRGQEIVELRSRPLPPLPLSHKKKDKKTDGKIPEKKIAGVELPWTKKMRDWLQGITPDEFHVRQKSVGEFLKTAPKGLKVTGMNEVIHNMKAWLEEAELEEGVENEIREELEKLWPLGTPLKASKERLIHLVRIAAIVEGKMEEEVGGNHAEAVNDSGAFDSRSEEISARLEGVLEWMEDGVEEILEWMELEKGPDEIKYLSEKLRSLKEEAVLDYRGEGLSLGAVLELMKSIPKVGWNDPLLKRGEDLLQKLGSLSQSLELARASLPRVEPKSVTATYKPIPLETLRGVRKAVLELGELPEMERRRGKITPPPKDPSPRSGKVFDLAQVTRIYSSMILVTLEGDENQTRYYFPEDLSRLDGRVKGVLKECGFDEERIAAEFSRLKEEALEDLKVLGIAIASLDAIIPKSFVRSDLVEETSPLTGQRANLTRLAQRLTRGRGLQIHKESIRVVVMADGRKVYFIDSNIFKKKGYLLRYPDFKTLGRILESPDIFEKFLESLKATGEEIPDEFVLTRIKDGEAVSGFRILSPKEAEKLSPHNFQIHFEKGGKNFIGVKGKGGMELGISFLKGKGIHVEGGVEKSLAAWALGGQLHAEKGGNSLLFSDLEETLSREGGTENLLRLYLLLKGKEEPEEFVLAGIKDGEAVSGFRILSPEEAEKLNPQYFQLHFEKGGKNFIGVKGKGGMELGISFLKGKGIHVEGGVEKSLAAWALGGQLQAEAGKRSLLLSDLEETLSREGGIENLLRLYLLLTGKEEPEEFVLAGNKWGKAVSGLKILSPEEAKKLGRNYFQLHFVKIEEGLFSIFFSNGTKSADLRGAFEEGVERVFEEVIRF